MLVVVTHQYHLEKGLIECFETLLGCNALLRIFNPVVDLKDVEICKCIALTKDVMQMYQKDQSSSKDSRVSANHPAGQLTKFLTLLKHFPTINTRHFTGNNVHLLLHSAAC